MTTPNASSGGNVTEFNWKKFPLEENYYSITLINNGNTRSKEFSNLVEYVKLIFPETRGETSPNSTIYIEPDNSWVISQYLFDKTSSHKNHIIIVGNYNSIPQTVFTNSRMIIFESMEDSNKYFNRHGIQVNSCDITNNFIVVDKSKIGHINIHTISKNSLIRYNKEFRLSQ